MEYGTGAPRGLALLALSLALLSLRHFLCSPFVPYHMFALSYHFVSTCFLSPFFTFIRLFFYFSFVFSLLFSPSLLRLLLSFLSFVVSYSPFHLLFIYHLFHYFLFYSPFVFSCLFPRRPSFSFSLCLLLINFLASVLLSFLLLLFTPFFLLSHRFCPSFFASLYKSPVLPLSCSFSSPLSVNAFVNISF